MTTQQPQYAIYITSNEGQSIEVFATLEQLINYINSLFAGLDEEDRPNYSPEQIKKKLENNNGSISEDWPFVNYFIQEL